MNILIALALFLQDKAAEATFQKIEETLSAAKTLKVTYQVESRIVNVKASVDQSSTYSGSLLLKDGNKALFTYKTDKSVSGLSSDGKRVLTRFTPPAKESKPAGNLKESLTTAFGRAGSRGILGWLRTNPPPDEEVQMKDLVRIDGIKSGEGNSLSYQLQLHAQKTVFEVQLWYDPKNFVPVKRTIAGTAGNTSSKFTEAYQVALDAEVSDADLQLK
jgi:hypothetical protein